jgi:hypothetical protein
MAGEIHVGERMKTFNSFTTIVLSKPTQGGDHLLVGIITFLDLRNNLTDNQQSFLLHDTAYLTCMALDPVPTTPTRLPVQSTESSQAAE